MAMLKAIRLEKAKQKAQLKVQKSFWNWLKQKYNKFYRALFILKNKIFLWWFNLPRKTFPNAMHLNRNTVMAYAKSAATQLLKGNRTLMGKINGEKVRFFTGEGKVIVSVAEEHAKLDSHEIEVLKKCSQTL